MFLIERDKELDTLTLGKIIQKFQTEDIPKLQRYYNYYKGRQKILDKIPKDPSKPCNRIIVNYCSGIVNNYLGYLTGIDITYSSDNFDDIQEVLNYNDVHQQDSELLRLALIFGRSAELNYIDEFGQQRFKALDPREVIAVYDDTIEQNLIYGIRIYRCDFATEINQSYYIEVYDSQYCRKYKSQQGFSSFTLLEEKQHFFGMVPITFFDLNSEQDSIFDRIITLQDAYNTLISGEVDDFEEFADYYLVLKGIIADDKDLQSMKENKVLMLDTDSSAEYLTKNISDTQVENLLQNINDKIYSIALSPDFNDERFVAQSGEAMKWKLLGMENNASNIEANMKKALQKRIELICQILNITSDDSQWRDVDIVFTRNLPKNLTDVATIVNQLRGLVSDQTLLSIIPFIKDPEEEMNRLQEQKQSNYDLYQFAGQGYLNE